jgi:hypothetical protein
MRRRTSRRGATLRRRILWIVSPLAVSLVLFLGVHSLFGVDFAAATPLLPDMPHFQFEQQAQLHCPEDSVVWATARRGVYNANGERWYGRTADGTFACLRDAEQAGYHASRAPQ